MAQKEQRAKIRTMVIHIKNIQKEIVIISLEDLIDTQRKARAQLLAKCTEKRIPSMDQSAEGNQQYRTRRETMRKETRNNHDKCRGVFDTLPFFFPFWLSFFLF